ncbi:hypothetical protein [Spiroplasma endosymbiont of Villa modesta]|uniref:hypothetical protein n=1 Tax=Spiroplasma endosymbiont of Villa modesta TaxID=3066293 RepID=UPI00313C3FC0
MFIIFFVVETLVFGVEALVCVLLKTCVGLTEWLFSWVKWEFFLCWCNLLLHLIKQMFNQM